MTCHNRKALEIVDHLLLTVESAIIASSRHDTIYTELVQSFHILQQDQTKSKHLFDDKDQDHARCEEFNNDHSRCTSLKRLLFALKLYCVVDDNTFSDFMEQMYSACLDDYNHLVTKHNASVQAISKAIIDNKLFTKCDMKHCQFTIRHHTNTDSDTNASDAISLFHRESIDGLHFWLFHQYDAGLRIDTNAQDEQKEIGQNEYYDAEFASCIKEIAARRQNVSAFDRFSSANSKYIMKPGNEIAPKTGLAPSVFGFGYWTWYEKNEDYIPDDSGHKVCDLFVEQKYSTFKEEIANYPSFSLKEYQTNVMVKVQKYLRSKMVKSIRPCGGFTYAHYRIYDTKERSYHYETSKDSTLSFEHLVSVILFTDYLKLNHDFRYTMRPKDALETLQSAKKRNSGYWWWSKLLRETVEIYGACVWGDGYKSNGATINPLHGPFYGGMSADSHLSAFNIRLYDATSTTRQLSVALALTFDEGAIVELTNPDMEQCRFLRGFDCRLLSRYKEEEEVLFMGGAYPVCVESVRLTKTMQNLKSIIYSFTYVDAIVSGGTRFDIRTHQTTERESAFIRALLTNADENTLDPYVQSTFKCFCDQKREIGINVWALYEIDERIRNMILHPLDVREQTDERKRTDDDTRNLLRSDIFKTFENVKTVKIASSLISGRASCSLSLVGLLSLFAASEILLHVVVTALSDANGNNWIKSLFPSNVKSIQKDYGGKVYTICVKRIKSDEYWLDIVEADASVADPQSLQDKPQEVKEETDEDEKEDVWHQGSPETYLVADNYYTVQSKSSGLYCDILDALTDNGAPLLQYYYQGNNNQLFSFVHRGDGKYSIHPMCSGKYIQVKDASNENGALFIQSDGVDGDDQQLFICEMDSQAQSVDILQDGCYRFRSVYNDKYIDVPGASKTKGVYLQQWDSHKGENQQFEIKRVDLTIRTIERGMGYVFEMTKHKDADCWLYNWFWSDANKMEFAKQLKENSIEEAIEWLVKAYRNSDGPDPWMNVLKDASDEDVQGVIDGLVKCKDKVLRIIPNKQ